LWAEQITKKMIRVNKAVRNRREWIKFGDCEGQDHGFKETGVVNIAEPVSFELAGQVHMKMSSCVCVCSYIYLISHAILDIPCHTAFCIFAQEETKEEKGTKGVGNLLNMV